MTGITVRVPRIDWSKGFRRRWNDENAVRTHVFNALSFLFPQGERFFIDVAREVASGMDFSNNRELEKAVKGFIAQESVHSQQHDQYNEVLQQQGFQNVAHDSIVRLQKQSKKHFSLLSRLAIVCAYEHYTAILGDFILSNPRILKPAEPRMALIWGWHCAEETEHKAVCFDLYRAAGGGWFKRMSIFLLVTMSFSIMFSRNYFSLLWRNGCMKPSRIAKTLGQSLKFFFGGSGVAWHIIIHGFRYLMYGFHPWDQDNRNKLQAWLSVNHSQLHQKKSIL